MDNYLWLVVIIDNYLWYWWLFVIIDNYLWLLLVILYLFLITLLQYISVVCINGGSGSLFFGRYLEKLI